MDEDGEPSNGGTLDPLVAKILSTYPYEFTLASTEAERAVGYRIRFEAAVGLGWTPPADGYDLEHDGYDADAVHVIGWYEDAPVSTGRLVLPPAALPTQDECGLVVEPAGRVVDVGRMSVVRTHQSYQHAAFIALLCRLYLEMRTRGYGVACGMMSLRARRLVGLLGLSLDVLGPDRLYWNELRAPVRFALTHNEVTLTDRWAEPV